MVKGVHVLGTGDITHPAWRAELREHLVRDESSGLYRCVAPAPLQHEIPDMESVTAPHPLFVLQGEISSIYKRHGKVRRVHNLIFLPDMDAADRLGARLAGIGNIASDGRPILGLDCRDLLELLLDTEPRAVLVPAHVWTPWFALFGSKSGFDSMEECFADMSPEIFALETGLSSDPAMNRLWSHLDTYALISNSDAHSGENLAREVNMFSGSPSYDGIFQALRRQAKKNTDADSFDCQYQGTVEFFPEEGKYHLDGHRACKVVLEPQDALALNNICPVCGKALTIGVLHRVLELADRQSPLAEPTALLGQSGFSSLIPLPELLGEILHVGAKSRKVAQHYAQLIAHFGPELDILHKVEESALRQHWEALGEGIARMRRGDVIRQGGYDGEYGTVRVFSPQEVAALSTGRTRACLPGMAVPTPSQRGRAAVSSASTTPQPATGKTLSPAAPSQAEQITKHATLTRPTVQEASEAQQSIMEADDRPLLVLAGPGAGKTRTLVGRIAFLLEQGVPARRILAVTFTRRAATELEERLRARLESGTEQDLKVQLPLTDTLHALAFSAMHNSMQSVPVLLSADMSRQAFILAQHEAEHTSPSSLSHLEQQLGLERERRAISPLLHPYWERYAAYKKQHGWVDYTDLLEFWLAQLTAGQEEDGAEQRPQLHKSPWTHVLVDEVQDLSPLQLALLRALLPPEGTGFFGIGDPDQAIYSFRGAQPHSVSTLRDFWPTLRCLQLNTSYRAAPAILDCATSLMQGRQQCGILNAHRARPASLHLFTAPNAQAEAHWIAAQICHVLGPTSHTLADAAVLTKGKNAQPSCTHLPPGSCAPGDIAVLVRLKAQIPLLHKILTQWGLPCAAPEQEGCWHHPLVALILHEAAQREGLAVPEKSPQAAPQAAPEGATEGATEQAQQCMPPCPDRAWRGGPTGLAVYLEHTLPFDALFWQSPAWRALQKLWTIQAGWKGLLSHIHLMQDVEMARIKAERVHIMTLHAAKGLEFKMVFLPGLEEGLLPLNRTQLFGAETADSSEDRGEAREEERRLLYVGITRASEAVFCSHAKQRVLYGRTLELTPSSFLRGLRSHCHISALVEKTRRTEEQLPLL